MKHLRYLKYIILHKWYVLVAGIRLGASLWRLLTHDLNFYGKGERTEKERLAFDLAWLKHQHRNPHHWQYWILREDNGTEDKYTILYKNVDNGAAGLGWAIGRLSREKDGEWEVVAKIDVSREDEELADSLRRTFLCHKALNSPIFLIEMPRRFVLEMMADWMGAAKAITGRWGITEWYEENRHKIILHPQTRKWVEKKLASLPHKDEEARR